MTVLQAIREPALTCAGTASANCRGMHRAQLRPVSAPPADLLHAIYGAIEPISDFARWNSDLASAEVRPNSARLLYSTAEHAGEPSTLDRSVEISAADHYRPISGLACNNAVRWLVLSAVVVQNCGAASIETIGCTLAHVL